MFREDSNGIQNAQIKTIGRKKVSRIFLHLKSLSFAESESFSMLAFTGISDAQIIGDDGHSRTRFNDLPCELKCDFS
jgi:hypothetical protein